MRLIDSIAGGDASVNDRSRNYSTDISGESFDTVRSIINQSIRHLDDNTNKINNRNEIPNVFPRGVPKLDNPHVPRFYATSSSSSSSSSLSNNRSIPVTPYYAQDSNIDANNIVKPSSFAGSMINSTVISAIQPQYRSVEPDEYYHVSNQDFMRVPSSYGTVGHVPSNGLQHQQLQHMHPMHQQPRQQQQNKRRITKACDYCRKRKIKCDSVNPTTNKCSNCLRNDIECTFFFHQELQKKKKLAYLKELSTIKSDRFEHNDSTVSATPELYGVHSDVTLDNGKVGNFTSSVSENVETLEGKMRVLETVSAHLIPLMSKVETLTQNKIVDFQNKPPMVPRTYIRNLITPLVMKWLLKETPTNQSPHEFIRPLEKMFDYSIKWYMIQKKKVVNFSAFLSQDDEMSPYPLPNREVSETLIRCFYESILHTSLIDHFISIEFFLILQKYYQKGIDDLKYSERFYLNVCLLGGLEFSIFQGIHRSYLPSIDELKDLRTQLYCNVMLYYSRASEGLTDFLYLKGLVIFSKLSHLVLNSSIAYGILEQASRTIIALRLNVESTYLHLEPKDAIAKRGIFGYFICRNWGLAYDLSKQFVMTTSESDILTPEANEFIFNQIITAHLSYNKINGKMTTITEDDLQKIANLKDIHERLNVLVAYPEYISFIIDYHGFELSDLDRIVYKTCFYINTTNAASLDTKFCEIIHINDRLRIWLESLSPALHLDSYKDYFTLLGITKENYGINNEYDGLCTRVITHNLHFYSLSLTVAQFALTIMRDNNQACLSSDKDIRKRLIAFENQYLDSASQITIIFCDTSNISIRYLEIREYVMSAIFTIVLNVVDNQSNKYKFIRNALLINRLQKTYERMVLMLKENFVPDNVKFIADLFIFAFLMKSVVLSFNSNNVLASSYDFNPQGYDEIIETLVEIMKKVKNEELKIFKDNLKSPVRHGSCKVLDDITYEFLDLVSSDDLLFNSHKIKRKPMPDMEDIYDVLSLYPFEWDKPIESQVSGEQQSVTDESNERNELFNNDDDFFKHFPFSEFFYDRNFAFDKTLDELNL